MCKGSFSLTAHSVAYTPRSANGKGTAKLSLVFPQVALGFHRILSGPLCLVTPHTSELAQQRKHLPPARGERILHTSTHMC